MLDNWIKPLKIALIKFSYGTNRTKKTTETKEEEKTPEFDNRFKTFRNSQPLAKMRPKVRFTWWKKNVTPKIETFCKWWTTRTRSKLIRIIQCQEFFCPLAWICSRRLFFMLDEFLYGNSIELHVVECRVTCLFCCWFFLLLNRLCSDFRRFGTKMSSNFKINRKWNQPSVQIAWNEYKVCIVHTNVSKVYVVYTNEPHFNSICREHSLDPFSS